MEYTSLSPDPSPVPSRNPIYRFISAWSNWSLPLKLSSMLVILAASAVGIYYLLATSGQIAFLGIGPSPTPIPVTPPITPPFSPSPYPSPSIATCVSRVKIASISNPCSTQGFYNIRYSCTDGRSFTIGDGKTCIDLFSAGNEARQKCGETCPSPSPRVCRPESGSCITKQNTCLSYTDSCAKADFCVFPIRTCASPSPSPSPTISPSPSPSYFMCVYNCVTKERKPLAVCREICKP